MVRCEEINSVVVDLTLNPTVLLPPIRSIDYVTRSRSVSPKEVSFGIESVTYFITPSALPDDADPARARKKRLLIFDAEGWFRSGEDRAGGLHFD